MLLQVALSGHHIGIILRHRSTGAVSLYSLIVPNMTARLLSVYTVSEETK